MFFVYTDVLGSRYVHAWEHEPNFWSPVVYDLFNQLGSYWSIMQVQLHEEWKTDKRGTSERFSANNFTLSDLEENTSGQLNRHQKADLPLLRILFPIYLKSCEPSFWKVLFYNISKFSSFKNAFATISSMSRLYFWCRFILLAVT